MKKGHAVLFGLSIFIIVVVFLFGFIAPNSLVSKKESALKEGGKISTSKKSQGKNEATYAKKHQSKSDSNIIRLISDTTNRKQQRESLNELYSRRKKHKREMMEYLSSDSNLWWWKESGVTNNVLEVVLLIAGLSGDRDYVKPMTALLKNENYVNACVYNCALIFSLSLLCNEKDLIEIKKIRDSYQKSEDGELIRAAAGDIIAGWKLLRKETPEKIDSREFRANRGILRFADIEKQNEYKKIIKLSPKEILKIAGDSGESQEKRLMAITTLSFLADSEDLTDDLLFVLLTLEPKYFDGADEYHGGIIEAIENIIVQTGAVDRKSGLH